LYILFGTNDSSGRESHGDTRIQMLRSNV
jgi:hypothetical protein